MTSVNSKSQGLHIREDHTASNPQGEPLIILTGPTAVGKSDLAVQLAGRIGGEIVSADSMQVYRGMDIGSAKITAEEMKGIPHHLIDVLDPSEAFDVVRFQQMTMQAMADIRSRDHMPIIAGGTGFYIQSVLYNIDFAVNDPNKDEAPDAYRHALEEQALTEEGRKYLFRQLSSCDPAAAAALHPNNVKRVIRALEYFHQTGQRISDHNEEQRSRTSPYNFAYFVLTDNRQSIYDRIDRRVDRMLENGLVQEVRQLKSRGFDRSYVSMQGLGYKEILAYLDGECSLEEAAYIIKRDTRHFAKRQLTWFRREPDVIWLDRSQFTDEEHMLSCMQEHLDSRHIG